MYRSPEFREYPGLSTRTALHTGPEQHPLKGPRQSPMTAPAGEGRCNVKPFRKRAALDTPFADLHDLPVTDLRLAFPYRFKHLIITRISQHIASQRETGEVFCLSPSSFSFQAFSPLTVDKFLQILLMDSHEVSEFEGPHFSLANPFPHGSRFDQEDTCCLLDGVNLIDHRLHHLPGAKHRYLVLSIFWYAWYGRSCCLGNTAFRSSYFHHTYMAFNTIYMYVYVT